MSHKLNSAVAEIGVEIGKDSFDVAGQDKRDEMHSEASSSSQPSIITRDQGRRGRPRVPSVTAIRKVCSIPEGDDKSGVVQCKISAEPVSVVGQKLQFGTVEHLSLIRSTPASRPSGPALRRLSSARTGPVRLGQCPELEGTLPRAPCLFGLELRGSRSKFAKLIGRVAAH